LQIQHYNELEAKTDIFYQIEKQFYSTKE
jgi:hypothetical protein